MKAIQRCTFIYEMCGTLTSCSTEGRVPPSLRRPQPVTVAFMPISRLSVSGRQMGLTCGANSSGCSSLTSARSYSYVKKLYFGCTTFLATPRSMYGSCSCTCEKSYSPTRMRICEISKLQWESGREWKRKGSYMGSSMAASHYSLVHTVPRRGYPVLVDQSATATMGAGEAKERGASHRHLPGPTTEGRALAAHNASLGPRQHRHTALCIQ